MVSKFLSRMFLVLALVGVTGLPLQSARAADLENTLYLDLQYGRVVIEMRPDLAPNHVARIKELTREGFYDGVKFHRVIQDFMAQTGDPTGTGRGGSGRKLRAEFSNTPHVRGIVSMARSQSPRRQPVLYCSCGFTTSRQARIHGLGTRDRRDGICRPDQEGRWSERHGPGGARYHRQDAGRGGRAIGKQSAA